MWPPPAELLGVGDVACPVPHLSVPLLLELLDLPGVEGGSLHSLGGRRGDVEPVDDGEPEHLPALEQEPTGPVPLRLSGLQLVSLSLLTGLAMLV
jgi:hypothetical protein